MVYCRNVYVANYSQGNLMVQVLFFYLTKKVKNKKVGYRRNLTVLSCFYLLAFHEMANY